MLSRLVYAFLLLVFSKACFSQHTATEYGSIIYNLILENNSALVNEFVELAEYTAYIDDLGQLPEQVREEIKFDASRSYNDVRKDFESECQRMLNLYSKGKASGITFSYFASFLEPSKNFPDIGFITCVYTTDLNDDEEDLTEEDNRDAFRFEAIKTASGWRILDGFFDATPLP